MLTHESAVLVLPNCSLVLSTCVLGRDNPLTNHPSSRIRSDACWRGYAAVEVVSKGYCFLHRPSTDEATSPTLLDGCCLLSQIFWNWLVQGAGYYMKYWLDERNPLAKVGRRGQGRPTASNFDVFRIPLSGLADIAKVGGMPA